MIFNRALVAWIILLVGMFLGGMVEDMGFFGSVFTAFLVVGILFLLIIWFAEKKLNAHYTRPSGYR